MKDQGTRAPRVVNWNSEVRVRLTPYAREVLQRRVLVINYETKKQTTRWDELTEAERDGTFTLWRLLYVFGLELYHGCPPFFERNEVEVP